MLYFKVLLLILWLILASTLGLIYAVLRWGYTNTNRDFARVFSWGALKILGIRVKTEGAQYLNTQPCIYVVNHQSGLDMVTMGPMYPQRTVVIGKKEVAWVPFFGIFYIAAGNVIIDRKKTNKAVAGLNQVVEAIRNRGLSIWIFPEGTRNRTGEGILPFKRGAFHMAIQAGVPIVPVVCSQLSKLVSIKGGYARSGSMTVQVLPPVFPTEYSVATVEKMADDVRAMMVKALQAT